MKAPTWEQETSLQRVIAEVLDEHYEDGGYCTCRDYAAVDRYRAEVRVWRQSDPVRLYSDLTALALHQAEMVVKAIEGRGGR